MSRAFEGLIVAACVALTVKRAGALTAGGAVAATVVGTLAVAAGWNWAALLFAYFTSSTLLSRLGKTQKEQRTAAIVEKGGSRDAVQVLANGGVFAGAAVAMLLRPDIRWVALGVGALAASAADTWATEAGTLWGREPRSILSLKVVSAGTSGGVSVIGSVAAVAGALFVAGAAAALGWTMSLVAAVAVAGVAGAFFDSLLGATLQMRRWCRTCARETEQTWHSCGAATEPRRGLSWVDNDVVNFLSTVAGGLLGIGLSQLSHWNS